MGGLGVGRMCICAGRGPFLAPVPDILVDFGIQLYLPWRISQGDVLYRDVMYLTGGPLSQYFNALLFKIFGVSFRTLIFANLAITAGLLVLVYRRFWRRRTGGRRR